MNVFQKLSFMSKIQKAVKAVKTVLKDAETSAIANKITGGINKIAEGLNDIKAEVPAAKEVINEILKVLHNAG